MTSLLLQLLMCKLMYHSHEAAILHRSCNSLLGGDGGLVWNTFDNSISQCELIGQWLQQTISLMYVGARHLEFGITSHIVT